MRTPTTTRARDTRGARGPHARRHALGATARRVAVDLTPQAVEQVAARVAALLRHDQASNGASAVRGPGLMTAKELARHLRLNPAWVYEHAEQLGAIRTGNGPKARMRFDLHTATQALKRHRRQAPVAGRHGEGLVSRCVADVGIGGYGTDRQSSDGRSDAAGGGAGGA